MPCWYGMKACMALLEECAVLVDLIRLGNGSLRFEVDCLVGTFTATLGCFGLELFGPLFTSME